MHNVQRNFLHADIITFPNEFTKNVIMRDYNLENLFTGKVAFVGYPRNSIFFNTQKAEEIATKFELKSYKTYAYMPTWRGRSNKGIEITKYIKEIKPILRKIDGMLNDDEVIFVNFHPIMTGKIEFDEFSHIRPFPNNVDTYEFLNALDVLITDYSSVFFDFSITKKPIILFEYDLDKYLEDRGVYFDIKKLPFIHTKDINELLSAMKMAINKDSSYTNTEYEKEFLKYDSPQNSKNVLNLLLDNVDAQKLNILSYDKNTTKKWRVINTNRPEADINDIKIISENAGDSDIIVFKRTKFKEAMSQFLYDNYKDKNFIFTENTRVMTYCEFILKRFSNKIQKNINEREMKRCLPNLKISEIIEKDIFYPGAGGGLLKMADFAEVGVDFKVINDAIEVEISEEFEVKKILIMSKNRILFDKEAAEKNRIVVKKEDLKEFISLNVSKPSYFMLCAYMLDKNTNECKIFRLKVKDRLKTHEDYKILGSLKSIELDIFDEASENKFLQNAKDGICATPYVSTSGDVSFYISYPKNILVGVKKAFVEKF